MKKALILSLLLCLGLGYAQDSYTYMLQGPGEAWLAASINPITGNFSAYNLNESDPDFVPLLFGGPATSSHIAYMIDGAPLHQSNLQVSVPLGPTVGYQIDGAFETNGVRIETAYFLMSTDTKGGLKTLGIAVLASNTSQGAAHRVGVKILLDTEIGETQNKPLLYLPRGQNLERPARFGARSLPEYIFAGERGSTAGLGEGKGFYIYPYLSTNFPSAVAVENWRRLASAPWEPQTLGRDFSYGRGSMDAGVGIYFGEYTLKPGEEVTMGAALSLEKIVTVPVLKDDPRTRVLLDDAALARGVFAPERYLINELTANPGSDILQEMLSKKEPLKTVPGRGLVREAPRTQSNGESGGEENRLPYFLQTQDPMGRQILKIDGTMEQLRQTYEENMGLVPDNPAYVHPPYNGITERYYRQ